MDEANASRGFWSVPTTNGQRVQSGTCLIREHEYFLVLPVLL